MCTLYMVHDTTQHVDLCVYVVQHNMLPVQCTRQWSPGCGEAPSGASSGGGLVSDSLLGEGEVWGGGVLGVLGE